jgi:hypothetical protein
MKILLTSSSLLITMSSLLQSAFAQSIDEQTKARFIIVNELVADLYEAKSNAYIFEKYLASRGKFQDSSTRRMANGITSEMKEGLTYVAREGIQVYHYPSSPQTVRRVRAIDDPNPNENKVVPLRFGLETSRPNRKVELNDLFRIESRDKQFISYVLFDEKNRIISFTGIRIGDKVNLFEF